MDFSKFKTSDWMIVGGGAAFVISGFVLDWASIDTPIGSYSGGHAFDWFFTGGLALIIAIVAATLTVMRLIGTKPLSAELPLGLVAITAVGLVLMLLRTLAGPGSGVGRGVGMLLSFVASAVVFAGAFLSFKETGGTINDLKDLDKLKAALAKPKPTS